MDTAIAQQYMNMVGQKGPYGTVSYTPNGNKTTVGTGADARTIDQYDQTTTLSPEQQRLLDLQTGAQTKYGETANQQLDTIKGTLEKPLDFSTLGASPTPDENMRKSVLSSMLQRQEPMFARDRAALETRLANQGIGIGSKAYNDAMDELDRSKNDFALSADTQAGNAMAQQYGLASDARGRSISEMIQQRQIPLNELAAMLTGSQVSMPSAPGIPQTSMQAPDIMGATYGSYNGQMQGYGQQVASKNANTQGTMGLVGTVAMAAAMAF